MNFEVQVENRVLEREMFYKETMILHYKINYPQFYSSSFTQSLNKMNRFYKDKAVAFQQYCEGELFRTAVKEYEYSVSNGFPVRAYEAQVDFTVTYNQDCAVSLYFDEYQFTGGAHGNTVRSSQTWNLQTGCRITLKQLFPYGMNYQAFLIQTIKQQIAEQIQNGENYYFDDYEKLVAETFHAENFYLTPDGLAIYFQQYDIAPYSSGIRVFIIPYTQGNMRQPSCKFKY